jgi:hypothetical protein
MSNNYNCGCATQCPNTVEVTPVTKKMTLNSLLELVESKFDKLKGEENTKAIEEAKKELAFILDLIGDNKELVKKFFEAIANEIDEDTSLDDFVASFIESTKNELIFKKYDSVSALESDTAHCGPDDNGKLAVVDDGEGDLKYYRFSVETKDGVTTAQWKEINREYYVVSGVFDKEVRELILTMSNEMDPVKIDYNPILPHTKIVNSDTSDLESGNYYILKSKGATLPLGDTAYTVTIPDIADDEILFFADGDHNLQNRPVKLVCNGNFVDGTSTLIADVNGAFFIITKNGDGEYLVGGI